MSPEIKFNSYRARRARTAAYIGRKGWLLLLTAAFIFGAGSGAAFLILESNNLAFGSLAISLGAVMLALWYRYDLSNQPIRSPAKSLDDIIESQLLASFKKSRPISPRSTWEACSMHWQAQFLCAHLLVDVKYVATLLSEDSNEMLLVWQTSGQVLAKNAAVELHAGTLATALLMSSPSCISYLSKLGLSPEDVLEVYAWLERFNRYAGEPHPYFGGIGRDWAAGFTPLLDHFGKNISREVEAGHSYFHRLVHADILDSIIYNLSEGSGAVALVGEAGTGKTSVVYALAKRLLAGHDKNLLYNQIISLNASAILSSAADELEKITLTLIGEAAHAKNIIIFLDDARLFFSTGTGAFDISEILLPLVENRQVKLIAAFTPDDLQQLKTHNQSLTSQIASVTVTEPEPELTMQILEDTALMLERHHGLLVSFQAVRESYRLSNQYMQELAYPGKAISLLEQAVPYADAKVISAQTIQSTVEKIKGVRVAKAEAPEAEILLDLESQIHRRMINQDRAVSVVAAALRRGRAGVADPKRPVGSFLFLGPTGVGKTELARSLAATYFGDERQMIRLDMSEYQRPEDVSRLLNSGGDKTKSLILAIREQPFSVVLLDEVEKAHTGVLDLLLQMLDEGQLTDQQGHGASFRSAVIICTSNAGSAEITGRLAAGQSLDGFERPLIDHLIHQGQFRAELINRFDEVVLFRSLNQAELTQVARVMLAGVNKTLANQNVSVQLTDAAIAHLVKAGYDPQFGARPMRRVIQKTVEDAVAMRILRGQAQPGSTVTLDVADLSSGS